MNLGRLLAVLMASLLIAGCGADASGDGGPQGVCERVDAVQMAELKNADPNLCPQAIALATARLGWLHWPITSTRFTTSLCPPNARCLLVVIATSGWVVFTFASGDPLMIHVGPPETGEPGLVAGDPEPLPEWLVEEIERAAT